MSEYPERILWWINHDGTPERVIQPSGHPSCHRGLIVVRDNGTHTTLPSEELHDSFDRARAFALRAAKAEAKQAYDAYAQASARCERLAKLEEPRPPTPTEKGPQ